MRNLLLSLLGVALLVGCAQKGGTSGGTDAADGRPSHMLDGTWKVVAIGGDSLPFTEGEVMLILDAKNSLFGGNVGCNSVSGNMAYTDYGVEFSSVSVTQMMCDEQSNAVERKMLDAINAVSTWSVANGALLLSDGEGNNFLTLEKLENKE